MRAPGPRRPWRAVGFVALLAAVAGIPWMAGRLRGEPPQPSYRQVTFRRGAVQSARFAPAGDTVLYSARFEDEPRGVYSSRLDTGETRSLGLGDNTLLAVARDEMAILLQRSVGAGGSPVGTLARVPLLGGAPR